MAPRHKKIDAVDLFCGAGGLTAGLRRAGVNVRAGYDTDENCRFAYESNNASQFSSSDVERLTGAELAKWYRPASVRLLAGCAPCQPFSTYNLGRDTSNDRKWSLLHSFTRLIQEVSPELVTMENVPDVTRHSVYESFVCGLRSEGYYVWADKVDCSSYGLPQKRFRHVLLASKLGEIELLPPTIVGRPMTVRDAIGHLPPITAGQISDIDPLHRASKLSPLNMRRIRASLPGGTWSDWPLELRAVCHTKDSGQSYPSVYGRMTWDAPSPTMTTLCHGFGNGRFGHPEQDRGISLREAALLQSFPGDYKFAPDESISMRAVGRMIGNAVPVRIAEVIGKSLLHHVALQGR